MGLSNRKTIAEQLQAKTRINLLVGLIAWLAMALTLVTASASGFPILHLIFFVLFIGAALAQVAFVRCPRCGGKVGLLMAQTQAPGRWKRQVVRCPFCGADFSEHA
jgi:DNA-directed RNA polymerase subunit RPC12/RpoP